MKTIKINKPFKNFTTLLLLATSSAVFSAYPEKPITLVVPWAAGGGTDATARTIASALKEELGQNINVVNRTGGSGVVGHTVMATAKPDGYTLGLATGEINMMHWQGLTNLTYKDFTPIGQINFDYSGIQVAANSPYNTVQELIDAIREQPKGSFRNSGTGLGGVWHLAFAGLLMDQGIEANRVKFIPSQGASPAMVELVSGGISIVSSSIPEGRSMIEAGRVKSLGIMSPERINSFPNVPTINEAIGSSYLAGEWRGIVGPKGMDPKIVATLEKALKAAYDSNIYQGFMSKQGFGVEWRNSKDFAKQMEKMDFVYGAIVEKVGLSK
ncbi:twin-arginine translocation pathway signal protein [Marinomonas ushuaiensis DSM 15871]|uniref:Twin-arginine translocation pathway signal protein n=1 Tax=Marinomonas ushuaiensis DSM 15871 TaxID=1122207 RepID=X7E2W0_9GAMM|nr:tripartite tricarboxylate transporter substrate binding protein [Marinomonas ushuaiensis]ETX10220.1 twin-arginine translocation pathway signal protein [Marinomonas ushuaiensis DSM 15871]